MPPSRRDVLAGSAVAALGALAGCSHFSNDDAGRQLTPAAAAAWPTRHGGSGATATNDVSGVETEPTEQWPDRSLPQYEDGVFTADGGGFVLGMQTVSAIDPDGGVRWRSDARYYGPLLLTDEFVLAQEYEGGLVGLDRTTGERAWTTERADAQGIAAGDVVGTTSTDSLAALEPGGGEVWSAARDALRAPPISVGDGAVVAAFVERYRPQPGTETVAERTTVVAFDADTGDEQWRFTLPGTTQRLAVRDGDVHVVANVRGETAALGAIQYVLSLSDGEIVARYNHAGVTVSDIAVDDEHAFAVTEATLSAFGPRLGPRDWEVTFPGELTSVAAAGSSVYVAWLAEREGETVVAALNAADGEEQWRTTLPADWADVVGVTDGRLFVGTSGTHGLYVLG
jgi:outer membrane protein assembly factor BamB